MQNELKLHPSYWKLHKQLWTEEFNDLDKEIAHRVINDPYSTEAKLLEKKVIIKIKQALSQSTFA
tara:strand:+ start:244 stop:438 length:195 start_codon:yes stop_codon:yes gene_type:complete